MNAKSCILVPLGLKSELPEKCKIIAAYNRCTTDVIRVARSNAQCIYKFQISDICFYVTKMKLLI